MEMDQPAELIQPLQEGEEEQQQQREGMEVEVEAAPAAASATSPAPAPAAVEPSQPQPAGEEDKQDFVFPTSEAKQETSGQESLAQGAMRGRSRGFLAASSGDWLRKFGRVFYIHSDISDAFYPLAVPAGCVAVGIPDQLSDVGDWTCRVLPETRPCLSPVEGVSLPSGSLSPTGGKKEKEKRGGSFKLGEQSDIFGNTNLRTSREFLLPQHLFSCTYRRSPLGATR